ncbi:MAG TPA: alkaline phosphatase D family protein [Acidimicrobiales bacterium]|nr:alkaline phosphatase D family protein [Acidimicrobiales bacterium]
MHTSHLARRDFLRRAGITAGGSLALLGGWQARRAHAAPDETLAPFLHGVASGDPLADRVVIWTRVTPDRTGPIPVTWKVARDPALRDVVAQGSTKATDARDFCVKVDVTGLLPGTTYYYGFTTAGRSSLTGRTKTAPAGAAERLRFAVVSCSNYPEGYFNAYRNIAGRHDLDAVIHLGDYLYEYGTVGELGRAADPPYEMVSLQDYRTRYSQYRLDPDLRAAHQQHPFITVWDDHESTNDAWRDGAENHDPGEGDWLTRKAISARVYDEWMPIRLPDPDEPLKIWRHLPYGDLADLVMLDTRLWGRDQQPAMFDAATDDPGRTMLGFDQEAWLTEQLAASKERGAAWRVLGQQVMFAPLNLAPLPDLPALNLLRLASEGLALNPDQWDGYNANRQRVLDVLRGANRAGRIDDVVVLTGDIHTSWANDVPDSAFPVTGYVPRLGRGSMAVEFVTPSVTSSNVDDATGIPSAPLELAAKVANPHVRWVDLDANGYLVLTLTSESAQSDWFHLATVKEPSTEERFAAAWATRRGQNHLSEAGGPATDDGGAAPAPVTQRATLELSVSGLGPALPVAAVAGAVALRQRREEEKS